MFPAGLDLGPHAAFIWASYAAVAIVLVGLTVDLIRNGRRLERSLADLDARRADRRARPPADGSP